MTVVYIHHLPIPPATALRQLSSPPPNIPWNQEVLVLVGNPRSYPPVPTVQKQVAQRHSEHQPAAAVL
jgi:hypothetical protein